MDSFAQPARASTGVRISGQLQLPARAAAHGALADLIRQGQYQLALSALATVLRQAPDDTEALHLAFQAHAELRQWQPALDHLERLLALKPHSPRWARAKANTLSNAQRHEEAARLGATLLKGPDDVPMLDLLKVCHFHLGHVEQAREYGQMALHAKDAAALRQAVVPARPHTTPPLPTTRQADDRRKVIAFSLWGSGKKYLYGAMVNSLLAPYIYPGWQLRFYLGAGVPPETVRLLQQAGAEVIEAHKLFPQIPGYFWRFLVMSDPSVERFLCRDCDCRLSADEAWLVHEWLASGHGFHVIRDHLLHSDLMLAGLWGGSPLPGFDVAAEIAGFFKGQTSNAYHQDQRFLGEVLWPRLRSNVLVHDSHYHLDGVATRPITHRSIDHLGFGHVNNAALDEEARRLQLPRL